MSRRDLARLNAWVEAQRPPTQPSTLWQWVGDALAMAYIGACGFVIIWCIFAL